MSYGFCIKLKGIHVFIIEMDLFNYCATLYYHIIKNNKALQNSII